MSGFKRILVPYDFSTCSRDALRLAADLARRFDASLTLLHVYQLPGIAMGEAYVLLGPEQTNEMLRAVDRDLRAAAETARKMEVAEVTVVSRQGAAAKEIVEAAAEGGYDLIVMGTHGRTGISHALIGSVAEKVVRKAPCPVLTVR